MGKAELGAQRSGAYKLRGKPTQTAPWEPPRRGAYAPVSAELTRTPCVRGSPLGQRNMRSGIL